VVDQLRTAIDDNEKWFDDLHHNYEEALQRVADLEHDIVGAEGDRGLVENELRRCQHGMDEMMRERDQAQAAIHELQTSLAEVEAQLSATVDDYTALLGSHGAELAEVRQLLSERDSNAMIMSEELRLEMDKVTKLEQDLKTTTDDYTTLLGSHAAELADVRQLLFERDSQVMMQTEQLRLETDKVAKLEGELKTSHLILASREGDIATLNDKIGQARFGANEKMFQARAEIDGLKREIEAKDAEVEEMAEEMRGMREEQDRSDRERGEVSCSIVRLDWLIVSSYK
jgi:chromosome segregation ATPase